MGSELTLLAYHRDKTFKGIVLHQGPQDYSQVWRCARRAQRSCYTYSYGLLQQRIKTKTSRGKGCLGWGLGETRCFPLPGVSSRGSHIAMHSTLPAMMWDMCEVLPTKEAWVSRVFIGDQPLTTQRPHDWPPRCRLQLLPSSIKGIFIINHTVRIDNSHVQTGRACFKAWGIQTSLLDRIFPRLTGYIPETA